MRAGLSVENAAAVADSCVALCPILCVTLDCTVGCRWSSLIHFEISFPCLRFCCCRCAGRIARVPRGHLALAEVRVLHEGHHSGQNEVSESSPAALCHMSA